MLRIQLNKEQTIKFLSCFIEDAKRIANERKQAQVNVQNTNTSEQGTAC